MADAGALSAVGGRSVDQVLPSIDASIEAVIVECVAA